MGASELIAASSKFAGMRAFTFESSYSAASSQPAAAGEIRTVTTLATDAANLSISDFR
jgi:hypothetical protein